MLYISSSYFIIENEITSDYDIGVMRKFKNDLRYLYDVSGVKKRKTVTKKERILPDIF